MINPPTDRQSWVSLIKAIYDLLAHPAGLALNSGTESVPSELDYEKLFYIRSRLHDPWLGNFYIEGEDDEDW